MGSGAGTFRVRSKIFQLLPVDSTHRPQSSSFLGLPYRILNMNPTKELLWGLWVVESMAKNGPAQRGWPYKALGVPYP